MNEHMKNAIKIIRTELQGSDPVKAAYNIVGWLAQLDYFDELEEDEDFWELFNTASNLEYDTTLSKTQKEQYLKDIKNKLGKLESKYR